MVDRVNTVVTLYERVDGVKSLAAAFVNCDFTKFFIFFSPQLTDIARDRNGLLE